jgi:hypothetical protein
MCVASDRACTRLTLRNLHGKEGVDGSSPSEGSAKAVQIAAFLFRSTCTSSSMRWVWSRLWSSHKSSRRRFVPKRARSPNGTKVSSPRVRTGPGTTFLADRGPSMGSQGGLGTHPPVNKSDRLTLATRSCDARASDRGTSRTRASPTRWTRRPCRSTRSACSMDASTSSSISERLGKVIASTGHARASRLRMRRLSGRPMSLRRPSRLYR